MSRRSLPSTSSGGRSSQPAQPREIARKLQSIRPSVPVFREEATSARGPPARYPSASVSTTSELDFLVDISEAPPAYTEEPLPMEQVAPAQSNSFPSHARRQRLSRHIPASDDSDSDSDLDVEQKSKKGKKKDEKKDKKKTKSKSDKETTPSPHASNTVNYQRSAYGINNPRNANNITSRGMSADQVNNYQVKRNRSKVPAPVPPSPRTNLVPSMYGYGYNPIYTPLGALHEGIPVSGYRYQPSAATSSPRKVSRKRSKKPQRRPTDPSSSSTNSSSDSSDSSSSSSDSDSEYHGQVKLGKKAPNKAYKQSMAVRHSPQLRPRQSLPYQGMPGPMMMPGMPMHAGSLPLPGMELSEQISATVNARLRRALGHM